VPYLTSFVVVILRKPHVGYDGSLPVGAEVAGKNLSD